MSCPNYTSEQTGHTIYPATFAISGGTTWRRYYGHIGEVLLWVYCKVQSYGNHCTWKREGMCLGRRKRGRVEPWLPWIL